MLGLGNSIISGAVLEQAFIPSSIANLALWYKVNTGITADADASGSAVSHTTDAGNMADGDQIARWNDQSGNNNHAVQATAGDKPHWETDAADLGGLKFDNTADMTFTAVNVNAEAAFTLVFRIKPIGFQSGGDVLIGDQSNDFFRMSSSANFRIKMAASTPNNNNFNDASNTLSTSVYSTIILTRAAGATGTLKLYVKPSNASEIDWASTAGNEDTDETSFSIIGSSTSGNNELNAFVKDVLIYNGTALDSGQRSNMYTYLENQ